MPTLADHLTKRHGQSKRLTKEEETALWESIKNPSDVRDRFNTILGSYYWLVLRIAQMYLGVDKSCLISAGIEGLYAAALRYDSSKWRFTPYAWRWISNKMRQMVQEESKHTQHIEIDNIPTRSHERSTLYNIDCTRALQALPQTERTLIDLRIKGLTLRDISIVLGITQQRTRRIENSAIAHLLNADQLNPLPHEPFHEAHRQPEYEPL
jgi:RNA polymerase sigma factor (sigma-70 family)